MKQSLSLCEMRVRQQLWAVHAAPSITQFSSAAALCEVVRPLYCLPVVPKTMYPSTQPSFLHHGERPSLYHCLLCVLGCPLTLCLSQLEQWQLHFTVTTVVFDYGSMNCIDKTMVKDCLLITDPPISVVAQWLRGRASDSQLRGSGFESCGAV